MPEDGQARPKHVVIV